MVEIIPAKLFSSPGAIVHAKEVRALRPDRTFSSSFPTRHNSTVSRIFETDADEELRTSSDSFNTRSANKSNALDFIWDSRQRVRQAVGFVLHSPLYLPPP